MAKEYQAVALDEEQSGLLSRTDRYLPRKAWNNLQTHLSQRWMWLVHCILLMASTTMFSLAYLVAMEKPTALEFTREFSAWSPAIHLVEYEEQKFNLPPMVEPTAFVGKGEEVDKAWGRITDNIGDLMVSKEEGLRLGLPSDSLTVKHPVTGVEGFRVGMEVFHQLHCLNLLRQFTWKEHYSHTGGDIETDPEDLRGHVDHCLETLRLALMCQSDIGVFGFRHFDGLEGYWPDYATQHTCRNYEKIRQWAMDNSVVFGDES